MKILAVLGAPLQSKLGGKFLFSIKSPEGEMHCNAGRHTGALLAAQP